MVSCVASVEVQLRVVEPPWLMEVGLAWIETVGFAGGGAAGGGVGGGGSTFFLPQPATKATARTAVKMAPRYKELETRIIRILLNVRNPLVGPPSADILPLDGWVREIHRNTIYCTSHWYKSE
jgi:hypothetical protein